MTDRKPGAPGQYTITITAEEFDKLKNGESSTVTILRDDRPILEGTPYSKAAVLPDALAHSLCPEIEDPTPADAFGALYYTKAPAGYGLGSISGSTAYRDANAMMYNGWYLCRSVDNTPFIYGWIVVDAYDSSNVWQTFYSAMHSVPVALSRCKIAGEWSEWEWKNPLFEKEKEYRTTERRYGKPIYKKFIEFGALPNSDTAYVAGCLPSAARDITLEGYVYSNDSSNITYEPLQWPIIDELWATVGGDAGYIAIKTTSNQSSWKAAIIASYTYADA